MKKSGNCWRGRRNAYTREQLLPRFVIVFVLLSAGAAAPVAQPFRFVILGDRTGETVPGIYEEVWKEAAAEKPAFVVSVGDTIQGLNDATAESEWQQAEQILAPYKRFPLYLAPGNHDIWSAASEMLFRKYARHAPHYSFDFGEAHFTVLDNSRSDQIPESELTFLEQDLKAHASQPLKFIVSHRPSWIVNVVLRDTRFPLHQLARKYGVQYVIAGHVHEMLHYTLDGVEYISAPSAGGHLRASGKYDDGWFFGYTVVDVDKSGPAFHIHEIHGRVSNLSDWSTAGLASAK
jgi:3',5'-cyclic-AMP phosphodiesterase